MEVENPQMGVTTAGLYWLINLPVVNVTLVYKFLSFLVLFFNYSIMRVAR
jgi:hypothetical protein